jgi:hypothetical protein
MLDAKARFRAAMESCNSHPWKVLRVEKQLLVTFEFKGALCYEP